MKTTILKDDQNPNSHNFSEEPEIPNFIGILSKYANPDLIPLEKYAWEMAAMEKHSVKETSQETAIEPTEQTNPPKSAFGILSKYANPDLIPLEEHAWEMAVIEKYGVKK
ncbi:MAG: hypothetical protein FWG64_08875 [Firmicutes bacterium]|nr:hypothetical protein [Bacillota bacterium]